MKYLMAVVFLAAISWAGCGPSSYTQTGYRNGDEGDTLPPPMTVQDVIQLSQAKVGDDVIIGQIRATESTFQLSTKDIVALKDAGVSDKVIGAMVNSSTPRRYGRAFYGYPGWYYPYGYPWYPAYFSFGLRYRFPHGGFYHYPYGFYRSTLGTFQGGYGRSGMGTFGGHGGGRPFGSHR